MTTIEIQGRTIKVNHEYTFGLGDEILTWEEAHVDGVKYYGKTVEKLAEAIAAAFADGCHAVKAAEAAKAAEATMAATERVAAQLARHASANTIATLAVVVDTNARPSEVDRCIIDPMTGESVARTAGVAWDTAFTVCGLREIMGAGIFMVRTQNPDYAALCAAVNATCSEICTVAWRGDKLIVRFNPNASKLAREFTRANSRIKSLRIG